jgi:hypothetical protein
MAGEASSIKTQVYMPGKGKSSHVGRQLTLDTIADWIRMQGFDEYTTNGLIELAERYPTQALPHFRRNFNLMIQRVRSKRKQETDQSAVDERPAGERPLGEEPVEEPVVEQAEQPMDDWQEERIENAESESEGGLVSEV